MGNFSEPLAIAQALPFEELAVLAEWQEFGSMVVSTIGGVIPGKILGEVVNNDTAASVAFGGWRCAPHEATQWHQVIINPFHLLPL